MLCPFSHNVCVVQCPLYDSQYNDCSIVRIAVALNRIADVLESRNTKQ